MPRYSAYYQNTKTGAARLEIRVARNYGNALLILPKWIFPGGETFRQTDAPKLYKDTDT